MLDDQLIADAKFHFLNPSPYVWTGTMDRKREVLRELIQSAIDAEAQAQLFNELVELFEHGIKIEYDKTHETHKWIVAGFRATSLDRAIRTLRAVSCGSDGQVAEEDTLALTAIKA